MSTYYTTYTYHIHRTGLALPMWYNYDKVRVFSTEVEYALCLVRNNIALFLPRKLWCDVC